MDSLRSQAKADRVRDPSFTRTDTHRFRIRAPTASRSISMAERPQFLFVTCHVGAEAALKAEIAREWPDFRFSFSRPGFVTFKLPPDHNLVGDFDLRSTFAQTYGFSLGRASGRSLQSRAEEVWRILGTRPVRALHVWQRDLYSAEDDRHAIRISPEAIEARNAILNSCPKDTGVTLTEKGGVPASRGDFVLDCVLVAADDWWIGYHRARGTGSRVAGGLLECIPPVPPVSRAWYKIEEALTWSGFAVPPGARFADLGCAPGGTSQALLQHGYSVLGIDPGEVSPVVLEYPNFRHLRCRAPQVRRREFRRIRWLTADMNVAPQYTLEAVESIVMHPEIRIRGMLLTLKLLEWNLAEQIPEFRRRVQQWGFNQVGTRQLGHHRQEFCLAALKKPFRR